MRIEQCLYGYQNGHQLLASSADLTSEEKRLLLFQTDLSGAITDGGFDEYLTGFPIPQNNRYAFCKTWYAHEMKRPGCVWTHTLLISFSDLGKIPELGSLTKFFRRPSLNDYAHYALTIMANETELYSTMEVNTSNLISERVDSCQFALYEHPDSTILVPAFRSADFEDAVTKIWSNQWPRLRRNFTFCSGALGLKTIDGREFDLQIVPDKNLSSIQRQTTNSRVMTIIPSDSVKWLYSLTDERKQAVRKFLWINGSDVEGVRKNFIPLLAIYDTFASERYSLETFAELLSSNFPSPEEAKSLKSKFFGQDSLLKSKYSEVAILKFLLATNDSTFASFGSLDIDERIKNLPPEDQLEVIFGAKPERITPSILKSAKIRKTDLVKIIERDESLIDFYLSQFPEIALEQEIWGTSYRFQKKVLKSLQESGNIENWTPYFNAIFEADSSVISDLSKFFGVHAGLAALDWLNQKDFSIWQIKSVKDIVNTNIVFTWLQNAENNPRVNILYCLFVNATPEDFQSSDLTGDRLLSIVQLVKESDDFPLRLRALCVLLALGLNNKIAHGDLIVSESFHEVFEYSLRRKIDVSLWESMPQDVALSSEKHSDALDIPFWIYPWAHLQRSAPKNQSEILLRTMVNKFIRNSWPKESFISAIKDPGQVQAVYQYCLSFKEGKRFLREVEDTASGEKSGSKS